jgi:hypothetical protein
VLSRSRNTRLRPSVARTVTVIVRRALAGDIEPAVAVLAAGFFSDPVLMWLVPDGRTRRRFFRGFFDAVFEDSRQGGELRVAEDEGEVCVVSRCGIRPVVGATRLARPWTAQLPRSTTPTSTDSPPSGRP